MRAKILEENRQKVI